MFFGKAPERKKKLSRPNLFKLLLRHYIEKVSTLKSAVRLLYNKEDVINDILLKPEWFQMGLNPRLRRAVGAAVSCTARHSPLELRLWIDT